MVMGRSCDLSMKPCSSFLATCRVDLIEPFEIPQRPFAFATDGADSTVSFGIPEEARRRILFFAFRTVVDTEFDVLDLLLTAELFFGLLGFRRYG